MYNHRVQSVIFCWENMKIFFVPVQFEEARGLGITLCCMRHLNLFFLKNCLQHLQLCCGCNNFWNVAHNLAGVILSLRIIKMLQRRENNHKTTLEHQMNAQGHSLWLDLGIVLGERSRPPHQAVYTGSWEKEREGGTTLQMAPAQPPHQGDTLLEDFTDTQSYSL